MITIILMGISLVAGVVAIVWFRRNGHPVLRSLGLGVDRRSPLHVVAGLVIPAIALTLVFLVERALSAIAVTAGAGDWSGLPGIFGQIVGFALLEELFFRVLLLSAVAVLLRNLRYGRWIAVLVTAAIFGAAHLTNEGATPLDAFGTGLGGLIYGIAFLATRSLWLPLFLHTSWNLSQALWGFPVSGNTSWPGFVTSTSVGNELLNGGAYGPEGGTPGMLARFVIIALVIVYVKVLWRDGKVRILSFAPDPQSKN